MNDTWSVVMKDGRYYGAPSPGAPPPPVATRLRDGAAGRVSTGRGASAGASAGAAGSDGPVAQWVARARTAAAEALKRSVR